MIRAIHLRTIHTRLMDFSRKRSEGGGGIHHGPRYSAMCREVRGHAPQGIWGATSFKIIIIDLSDYSN